MKKLITIFLIAFSINGNAQIEFQEDYSFKTDKQLHVYVGAGLGAGIFGGLYSKTKDAKFSMRGARILSGIPIMMKEGLDLFNGKEISIGDMLYSFLGVEAGAQLTRGIVKWKEHRQLKKIKEQFDISFLPDLKNEPLIKR